MADSYEKKERRKKKEKKKKEKLARKEARKNEEKDSSLESMMAYVDENGQIVDTPPETPKKEIDPDDIVIGVPEKGEEEDVVLTGKVQFFNESKGYGFIKDNKSQETLFFHINNLLDEVSEGTKVTYSKVKGKKGMEAIEVKKLQN